MKIDEIFEFRGYHGFPSKCRIRAWLFGRIELSILVMMSDIPDGGTSITNASEVIATKVMQDIVGPKFDLEHDRVTWIEHYPRQGENNRDPVYRTSFDLVTYKWLNGKELRATSPSWTRVSKAWIEELIKDRIEEVDREPEY